MWDKKKKEDNGAAFNGPQNSQPLFTGKYDGPIFRTTAETEEVLLSSAMSEYKGPAVMTERAPCWEESARSRITCCMSINPKY